MSDNEDAIEDGGLPEPQIGPTFHGEVNLGDTRGAGDAELVAAIVELALSQDSLDHPSENMSRPTTPPPNSAEGSRRTSRASSRRSSRSSGHHQRIVYAPSQNTPPPPQGGVVSSEAPTPRSGRRNTPIENPFEIKDSHLQPLVSAGQREASWVDAVVEQMMPQLKEKLKEEFERDRIQMEQEHERRLKELHEQHQNEQFELYEKNVALYEKIARLERRISAMNEASQKVAVRLEKSSERQLIQKTVNRWRSAVRQRQNEKQLHALSEMMYKRILIRRCFNQWSSTVKAKWKGKVEKGKRG